MLLGTQTPLFVRPLTADERATLETGLRSASAFTVRRCQILLASAERQPTTTIARDDLVKFLAAHGHPPRIVAVSGRPEPAASA